MSEIKSSPFALPNINKFFKLKNSIVRDALDYQAK